jgi:hypothetical protein
MFILAASCPPQADALLEFPVFAIDAAGTGSNPSFGFLYGLSLLIEGGVTAGADAYGGPELPLFTVKSQMAATGALELPCFRTDVEYLTGRTGNARTLRMPRLTIDTLAYNPPIINGGTGFPVVKIAAGALTGGGGEFDGTLPAIKMPSLPYVNAFAGGVSGAAAVVPVFAALMSGYGEYKGEAAAAIPLFAVEAMMSFREGGGTRAVVLNVNTGALTEYTSFDFNGFCQWGDDYFAEGEGGIYVLGANDDDGVPISCSIRTSKTELKDAKGKGESAIKHVPEVYAVVRTPSPFVFKAITDDAEEHAYLSESTAPSRTGRTAPERIKLGKGARGRYWTFAIENTAGAAMEIESFEPEVASLGRRV